MYKTTGQKKCWSVNGTQKYFMLLIMMVWMWEEENYWGIPESMYVLLWFTLNIHSVIFTGIVHMRSAVGGTMFESQMGIEK